MDDNMLTTKETILVEDLICYELLALKKSRLYARILTDKDLCKKLSAIADNHEKRVKTLLASL